MPVDINLRPASPNDWPLIRSWLGEPHVAAWWGSRASGEASITIAMDAASALVCIIEADGVPVGYAHALDIVLWGEAPPPRLPAGTWDRRLVQQELSCMCSISTKKPKLLTNLTKKFYEKDYNRYINYSHCTFHRSAFLLKRNFRTY